MTQISDIAAKVNTNLASIRAGILSLDAQILAWQNSPGNFTGPFAASDQALLDQLVASSAALAKLANAPVVPPVVTPPADDAAILVELTDSTVAGMNKRLGPVGDLNAQMPDVWTRPQVPVKDFGFDGGPPQFGRYSDGLAITAPEVAAGQPKPGFDYGSDELGAGGVDDGELQVNPNDPNAVNSDGGPGPKNVGVWRLRLEEHAQGAVEFCPVIPWNDPNTIPDSRAVVGHTASYGMGNKLGRLIQFVRARINRDDGGFGLYDGARGGAAYIGTMPTKTAWSPWSGEQLDINLVPLCFAVFSQNEFLVVGVHDKNTNTGKLVFIANWGSQKVGDGQFPFDFRAPMPGLLQSGVITGMKIIGTVDLPVKWPTSVSIATSRNTVSDRIEGPSGNAAYLDEWPMDTKAERDAFMAKNGGWIPTWAKIVVASSREGKVVQMDATALVQGYRDQYFTTDALYAASRPQNPGGQWYAIYNTTDPTVWPYMLPGWVPTVTRVIDLPGATVGWMLETNDGAFVVGCADGMLHWFKDDGTMDGSLRLDGAITAIRDDKYLDGVRKGDLTVTSRQARTVYGIQDHSIEWKLQDARLVDPVDAGTITTHGITARGIWVLDFAGKALRLYRNTDITLQTQGGTVFGTGPNLDGKDLEHLGSFDLPGHPVSGADGNVN